MNLRAGNEPGIGIDSAILAAGGIGEIPDDLALSTRGDLSGVSNG